MFTIQSWPSLSLSLQGGSAKVPILAFLSASLNWLSLGWSNGGHPRSLFEFVPQPNQTDDLLGIDMLMIPFLRIVLRIGAWLVS